MLGGERDPHQRMERKQPMGAEYPKQARTRFAPAHIPRALRSETEGYLLPLSREARPPS
jgi:hypothetical protein